MPINVTKWQDQMEFDIYAINTREMNSFFQNVSDNNWDDIAQIFTKVIVKMPAEWGDPQNVDDLMENIPYPIMRKMLDLFLEAFKETQKN